MIKVFTTNKDGKIELTKDELKALLDEAYWDGYRNNSVYVYNTPAVPNWTPYKWDITCSDATIKSSDITAGTVTVTHNNEIEPKKGQREYILGLHTII